MRILIVSNLFPPVTSGGYEVECGSVAEHLGHRHEVLVLSSAPPGGLPEESGVRRVLPFLGGDARGARQAPLAALRGAAVARRALEWSPDLVYAWNCAAIPQSTLRLLADTGVPVAFRVCEHWFGGLFTYDQFMRELLPARRGAARRVWAQGCRAFNRLPQLRLSPGRPLRTAISWNSRALEQKVDTPSFLEPVLEAIQHPVPSHGEIYERVERAPAPDPEIMFLGRVTAYKGLGVAVEALAKLRAAGHPTATLVVVGPEEPTYVAQIRELAGNLGVNEAISWRGQLSPEQSAAALSRAHALIVPSVWEEPFGLVAIEGAMARVPVVAADVGGISEGLHAEEHALLFARGDSDGAAAALARVLEDPQGTAARVARARERSEAFRLTPYLEEQERFVIEAHDALSGGG
ncbi:MAG TPA: glycosyltransferase family 4 protein [Solirubrobacteraceae bacterium]|jgi:glycosyltransferase involved in cell wall biosynthesis|nr:glycosyltransferase family 4 protein [Solirubrobacteraceae bacterium]